MGAVSKAQTLERQRNDLALFIGGAVYVSSGLSTSLNSPAVSTH